MVIVFYTVCPATNHAIVVLPPFSYYDPDSFVGVIGILSVAFYIFCVVTTIVTDELSIAINDDNITTDTVTLFDLTEDWHFNCQILQGFSC